MQTMLMGPDTLNVTLYNCASFSRCIHKTVVQWLQPGEFPKFDLIGFKEVSLHFSLDRSRAHVFTST